MIPRRLGRPLLVLAIAAAPAAAAPDPFDSIDESARDWVRLRLEAARVDSAWRTERELLESTLAALDQRAAALAEKRDLARARTAQERGELDTLRAQVQGATDDLKAGEARLAQLTARLVALRPSLPPRLSEALEMSFRSLAAPGRPFAERLQLAMTVLDRCAQFNRVVTAGEDALAIEGEANPLSLEVIYWGLSHGYAVDRPHRRAWLGRPGPAGWHWEPHPEAYDAVVQLLAVAHDQADPAFVGVPAQVATAVPAAAP